jgi:3-hydroxyacyl-[acyl-carrier-protein] dehydratase
VPAKRTPRGEKEGNRVKFVLVDRISEFTSGQTITAHKAVSLAEEYLADHFPTFPVLPGVMMVEAAVQAAAWIVREHTDFATDLVLLREARNVTYKSFVAPGQTLTVRAECKELTDGQSVFAVAGDVAGRATLKGKLTLRHLNLIDLDPELAEASQSLRSQQRALFHRLCQITPEPEELTTAPAGG